MLELMKGYFKSQNKTSNFKFSVVVLEDYIIHKFKDLVAYDNNGGYKEFYRSIKTLEAEGAIKPVKALEKSCTNGKRLPEYWWAIVQKPKQNWTTRDMMMVSSTPIELDFYTKNPQYQNKETWEAIIKLYTYFKQENKREWVSKQERAYQIFGHEKALDNDPDLNMPDYNKILSRLKISDELLKMREYGEPFVYWLKQKKELNSVSRILIIENLSFFHSCKRYLRNHVDIFGVEYDMLIYGSGRHIENNLSFIYEILDNDNYSLDYVGDIDPTGLDIYMNLKERYPSLNIKLALNIYSKMVEKAYALNVVKQGQRLTDEKLELLLSLDEVKSEPWLVSVIEKVVQERVRVPQEAISYEYLVGGNVDDQSGNTGRVSRT